MLEILKTRLVSSMIHRLASNEHCYRLKFVLFCFVLKSGDGQLVRKQWSLPAVAVGSMFFLTCSNIFLRTPSIFSLMPFPNIVCLLGQSQESRTIPSKQSNSVLVSMKSSIFTGWNLSFGLTKPLSYQNKHVLANIGFSLVTQIVAVIWAYLKP